MLEEVETRTNWILKQSIPSCPICETDTNVKLYGWPRFSKDICKIDLASGHSIIEVPMSTLTVLGETLPAAGGGYIRHFPYAVTKWAIKHIQKSRPAIVYMHPYEIDTEPRAFSVEHLSYQNKKKAFRFHNMQLRNRSTMQKKIFKLLTRFKFTTLEKIIENTKLC